MYGVTGTSTLNQLSNFHVVNQLPQDIMHVLLEGVIPFEMTLMLKYFVVDQEYFSIAQLNERIASFSFTQQEARDKPSPIKAQIFTSQGGKLNQSGMHYSFLVVMYVVLVCL